MIFFPVNCIGFSLKSWSTYKQRTVVFYLKMQFGGSKYVLKSYNQFQLSGPLFILLEIYNFDMMSIQRKWTHIPWIFSLRMSVYTTIVFHCGTSNKNYWSKSLYVCSFFCFCIFLLCNCIVVAPNMYLNLHKHWKNRGLNVFLVVFFATV